MIPEHVCVFHFQVLRTALPASFCKGVVRVSPAGHGRDPLFGFTHFPMSLYYGFHLSSRNPALFRAASLRLTPLGASAVISAICLADGNSRNADCPFQGCYCMLGVGQTGLRSPGGRRGSAGREIVPTRLKIFHLLHGT